MYEQRQGLVTSLMINQQVVATLCLGEDSSFEVPTGNLLTCWFFSVHSYYAALDLLLPSCYYYGHDDGTCSTNW